MFVQFGFVSAPFAFVFAKAFFNFTVQMLLFFGKACIGGRTSMQKKLSDPRG